MTNTVTPYESDDGGVVQTMGYAREHNLEWRWITGHQVKNPPTHAPHVTDGSLVIVYPRPPVTVEVDVDLLEKLLDDSKWYDNVGTSRVRPMERDRLRGEIVRAREASK